MSIVSLVAGIIIGLVLGATVAYTWVHRQIGGVEKKVTATAQNVANDVASAAKKL